MVQRCKKCGNISEVTSGGRGEIENLKNDKHSELQFHLRLQMLLLKCHCTFSIYGALGKMAFCRILKRWLLSWITSQNFQRLKVFVILASFLWGNLKKTISERLVLLHKIMILKCEETASFHGLKAHSFVVFCSMNIFEYHKMPKQPIRMTLSGKRLLSLLLLSAGFFCLGSGHSQGIGKNCVHSLQFFLNILHSEKKKG